MKIISFIAKNRWVNFLIGLICIYTGIMETYEEWDNIVGLETGVHHGVLLIGINHLFGALKEILESVDYFNRS